MSKDGDEATVPEAVDGQRRRSWSAVEKVRIVEESLSGNRQASRTARRHGIPNSLLFRWRKAYQEGRLGSSVEPVSFISAVVTPEPPITPSVSPGHAGEDACGCEHRMEIVARGGRRVIVGPAVEPAALRRVLTVLEAL
ncbi:MAG: transposase [Pseudomonadales bacterium]